MIFFDNCRPILWVRQYLSIRWFSDRRFRPPAFLLVLLLFLSSTAFGMQVTLNLKSVSLETAFAEIKKQSGYGFWYEKKDLEGLPKVSLSLRNVDLVTALEACLKGQPLSYQLFDKTVVVKRKAIASPALVPAKKPLQEKLRGKIVDEQTKEPLAGVLVKVKAPAMSVVTDDKGMFEMTLAAGKYDVVVQYMGYGMRELVIAVPLSEELVVELIAGEQTLEEVQFVSTGYQSLPKERATGSFVLVDNKLLNRSVGTNLLERLDGVTSGLIFNKNSNGGSGFNTSTFSVRGRSTILGDANPLIILDNFPYSGDLSAINPNDVESITILKDAAAASIWGSKAGNGVVVITTKSGKFNQKTSISFQSNLQLTDKPLLYSRPQLTSGDYIEVERDLFLKGKYNAVINNGYGSLSPAVEILLLHRNGEINDTRRDAMLDSLSKFDIRSQQLKYYYRNPILQQYQFGLNGGTENQKFVVSAGFDHLLGQLRSDSYSRKTFNLNNTYTLFNKKLELNSILQFSSEKDNGRNMVMTPRFPYENWIDESGRHLAVTDGTLRLGYAQSQQAKGLLDWMYRPLDENQAVSNLNKQFVRLSTTLNYKLNNIVRLTGYYTYQRSDANTAAEWSPASFYVRNLVNSFSSVNNSTGEVTRAIPLGGIFNQTKSFYTQNAGRLQLLIDKRWEQRHSLSGLAGVEVSDVRSEIQTSIQYGYDSETGNIGNQGIDFSKDYNIYYSGATRRVNNGAIINGTVDRFLSYYGNFSYSFDDKYTLSTSIRKDESNLFGVKVNQKGVPLWSAGLGWVISKERFFQNALVDLLKFRMTYGYSGNVDKSTSAYLTATRQSANNRWNVPQSNITNPPNPSLSWERVANINLGIDFSMLNNRIAGSLEFYRKKGMDLIGTSPIAPQTGVSQFRGNSAELETKGIDIILNSRNLQTKFSWTTTLLLNFVNDKVTKFYANAGSNYDIVYGDYNNPQIGYPYNSLYSFKWAGLDNTGAPRGYLEGQISQDYNGIRNSVQRNDIIFHGSRSPTVFGSILNHFSWSGISLSFNISYKLGYFLRKESLDNFTLYNGGYLIPDYANRWKSSGDENSTNVPSLIYPGNSTRNSIYSFGETLTYRGDHIRLRDIRIDYDLKKVLKRSSLKSISLNLYFNNVGMIWKENSHDLDPDSPTMKQPRQYAVGIKAAF